MDLETEEAGSEIKMEDEMSEVKEEMKSQNESATVEVSQDPFSTFRFCLETWMSNLMSNNQQLATLISKNHQLESENQG